MTTLWLLAALAAAEAPAAKPDVGPKPVPTLVREVLADKKFRFCHDPQFPLTSEEAAMCPFVVSSNLACPALAEVCKTGTGATRREMPKKLDFDLPDLGGLPRLILLALLVGAIGAVIYVLVKNIRPWQRKPKEPEEAEEAAAVAAVSLPQEVESDVDRLLGRARAAAAAGDYARAIMELHAALLRRLEGAGLVAVHPSRTNGDYVRAVAGAKPELVAPVRSIVIDVERVQYGHGSASAELFQALMARVQLVTLEKLLVLVLVGATIFGSTSCLGERGGWEYSPSGRAGVMRLLERAGRQVKERLTPLAKLKGDQVDAVVLLPGAEISDADWSALSGWVSDQGGTLVLAGMPDKRPDWVGGKKSSDSKLGPALNVVGSKSFDRDHGPVDLPLPPSLPLEVDAGWEPRLMRGKATANVYAAEKTYEEGTILALADDRLFTNGALPFGDNARALILLLSDTMRVELVGELTGFVSPNPVASVARGQLAPFLGQLMLLSVLFFLLRGVAFGRLREPPPPTRRSFVEHVEAVGEQYARARAARHVLASYGHWVTERLRERVALPAGSGFIALADAVAVRTGKEAGEVMRLLMEAREVPAPAAPGTAEEVNAHLAAVRALGELLVFRAQTNGGTK
jgi:hypothetical protein